MKLPAITERQWQEQVIGLARLLGYRVAHFRGVKIQRKDGSTYYQTPVQADGKGFVDLVIAGRGRIFFVELKTETGRLSDAQEDWIAILREAGQDVRVWRPSDWETIQRVLA